MHVLLGIIALLVGLVGGMMLSPATQGVGVIALACLFGILARIMQAGSHRADDAHLAKMQADAAVASRMAAMQPQMMPPRT